MKTQNKRHIDRGAIWNDPDVVKKYIETVRGGVPFSDYQLETMLFLLKNSGRCIKRFLDLGCGNGILSGALLLDYPEAEGVLVDNSEVLLKEAAEQLKEHSRNIELVNADLESPRWLDSVAHKAKYDAVLAGYLFSYLPKERRRPLLNEIFSLLSPGGMFICLDQVKSPSPWVQDVSDTFGLDHMLAYARKRGAVMDYEKSGKKMKRSNVRFNDPEPLTLQLARLKNLGFVEVDCCFKVFESAVFSGTKPGGKIIRMLRKLFGGG